VHVPVEIVGVG